MVGTKLEELESRVLELETENSELKKKVETLKADNSVKTGWWMDVQKERDELKSMFKSLAFMASKMAE